MKNYFLTGTDTDVGKTTVSAILTLALKAAYWKPIQSGVSDRDRVQQLTNLPDENFFPSAYSFRPSLSPDQAAALENKSIDLANCLLPKTPQPLIVEGAGGVFVPLNREQLMLDLIKQLQLPVIIVARGTIGTINHTLLTISALRKYEIKIAGVVFNGELNPDNQKAIEQWGQVKTLFHVPFFKEMSAASVQSWAQQESVQLFRMQTD